MRLVSVWVSSQVLPLPCNAFFSPRHDPTNPTSHTLLKVFEPRYRKLIKRCLERHEPFGLIHAESAVGTLCYVSEVYSMDTDTGVSLVKVTGYRRFSLENGGTHVPPDSFGLLVARRAAFFEEEEEGGQAERLEMEELMLQAEAYLKLQSPEASILPTTSSSNEGGGAAAAVSSSFVLAQYITDHFGVPERRKLEWLAGTATVDRMRDCLDLLLERVRRGAAGPPGGGALAAAAEQGEGGSGRRGRGRREQD